METVIAAALMGASAIGASWVQGRRTKASTAATEALKAEVQTNHGMRAGEYLEKIHTEVVTTRQLADLAAKHASQVAQELAAHTIVDAENFESLRRLFLSSREDPRG